MSSEQFDIDIDFGDRDAVLKLIKHTPAAILRDGAMIKHNTGVYVNPIPLDPFTSPISGFVFAMSITCASFTSSNSVR